MRLATIIMATPSTRVFGAIQSLLSRKELAINSVRATATKECVKKVTEACQREESKDIFDGFSSLLTVHSISAVC